MTCRIFLVLGVIGRCKGNLRKTRYIIFVFHFNFIFLVS